MKLNRREFLQGCAAAAAVVAVPRFLSSQVAEGASLTPGTGATTFGETWFARQFGVTEELVRKVMTRALARGGDFCDLYFEHSLSDSVGLEDGVVNSAYASVDLGVGVRVVQGTHYGYAFTQELTLDSMLKAAETASAIAKGAPQKLPKRYGLVSPANYYPIQQLWETVGIEKKMPWLLAIDARMKAKDKRVVKGRVYFSDASKRIMVVTSEGRVVEDFQPEVSIGASCVAEQNGKRERASHNFAVRNDISFVTEERLNEVADEAVRRALQLFDAVKPPAGEMPVVLAAGASGILLHEAIGHGMEADFNRKGVSIFADKMGKKVANPEVTVVDSGLNPHYRGTLNVDDEGSDTQRTVLVEQGVMASYLHDRISAKHYGLKSTGSGRRESYQYPPIPRMRNTYMENGPHTPEELIRSVKKGIFAEQFTNGQVRIGEGSFSFYVSCGNLIEDGKLTAPIKDINIIGNGPEVLSRVTMVANDLKIDMGGWTCGKDGQGVPVSQGLPTTLVSSITIGGTNG